MSLPARTLAPSRAPRRPAPTETSRASSARGRRIARARARDGGGDGGGGGGGARGTTEAIEEDGRDASGVFTRAATTKAHAEAAARVCGDAFARETRERERGGGDEREVGAMVWFERSSADADGLEGVVGRVRETLDASYADSIAKELTHMTKHQIEEKRKAREEGRTLKTRGIENAVTARLREKAQCLTLVSRFASSKDTDGEDEDGVRIAVDPWVGSASLRVCSPEALLPEPFPTSKPRVPYVSNVAVRADARGRGVASAMLLKCERASRLWGYDHLWLHVDRDNPNARAMYERRGYVAVGEDPWWYGLGGLLGKRRILLKKRLSSSSSE